MSEPPMTGWVTFIAADGDVVMREYIPTGEHDGFDCPECEPWWAMECDQCEGEAECWKCEDGYVSWTRWGGTLHLIHRDE